MSDDLSRRRLLVESIIIAIEPRPKRLWARSLGKVVEGRRPRAAVKSDTKTAAWEKKVADLLRQRLSAPMLAAMREPHQPLRLDLLCAHARPKYLERPKAEDGYLWRPTRPDRSNLLKSAEDAVTKAELWGDDCQVVAGESIDLYAPKGIAGHVIYRFEVLFNTPAADPRVADLIRKGTAHAESLRLPGRASCARLDPSES